MNIAVIGLGHVGLAYALLFASKYKVVAYDIDSVKINNLKKGTLPSKNEELMKFFCENNLNITFLIHFLKLKIILIIILLRFRQIMMRKLVVLIHMKSNKRYRRF